MLNVHEDLTKCYCSFDQNYLKIKKFKNKKNLILFSGGIDSQALCLYFQQQNIPYETLFADYGFNKEDKEHTQQIGVNHKINIDLDNLFFDKKIHLKYFEDYNCTSPQIAIHLYIILYSIDAFTNYNIFTPSRPIFRNRNQNFIPDYNELGYQRLKEKEKLNNFFPYFFINFEIANKIKTLSTHSNHLCNSYTKKFLLYQELGLLVKQQSCSCTGFEDYKLYLKAKNKPILFDKELRKPVEQGIKKIFYK